MKDEFKLKFPLMAIAAAIVCSLIFVSLGGVAQAQSKGSGKRVWITAITGTDLATLDKYSDSGWEPLSLSMNVSGFPNILWRKQVTR